jgi:phage shock protein E
MIMSLLARIRSRGAAPAGAAADEPVDLSPAAFLRRRQAEDPVLDVRTGAEFHQAQLHGALHVDILGDRFMERVEGLGLDPDKPVYLYCRTGNRSGHAARMLRQAGFARAFNVGGLDELLDEGAETA